MSLLATTPGKSLEQGCCAEGADRVPVTEDHRGQRDEAATCSHSLLELADCFQDEECTGQAGKHATKRGVYVAVAVDVDADGVGGAGVFADGARAQAPAGIEQADVHDDDHDEGEVGDGRVVEEDRSDHGDLGQSGNRDRGELAFSDGVAVVEVGGGSQG